jgi:hypothetical protein
MFFNVYVQSIAFNFLYVYTWFSSSQVTVYSTIKAMCSLLCAFSHKVAACHLSVRRSKKNHWKIFKIDYNQPPVILGLLQEIMR